MGDGQEDKWNTKEEESGREGGNKAVGSRVGTEREKEHRKRTSLTMPQQCVRHRLT